MASLLVDAAAGWLFGVLGQAGVRLAIGSQDERLLRRSMAGAVEAVIERADPGSRDGLRKGLAECFSRPTQVAFGGDVAGGLRAAVAGQVEVLASMQATDGSGRMFFDTVDVEQQWLATALAEAFETALRHVVTSTSTTEYVRALDAERVQTSLSEQQGLLLRLVEERGGPAAGLGVGPGRVLVGVIPATADCFQHRQVSVRLEAAAAVGGAVVLCPVLTGIGGVGKTQLAAAYARAVWERGQADVVAWVTAASQQQIVDGYARAAVRVVPGTDPADPVAAAQRFLEWMAETTTEWLVVLDDVHQPGDLAGWWPPRRDCGRVLVTTRYQGAAWGEQRRTQIDVAVFTPAEAHAYINAKLAGQDHGQTEAESDALAAELGRLPLALAQATAYIINEDLNIAAYRELLRDRLLADAAPGYGDLPDEQTQIVAAAWELSVERANQARPAGLAHPLLSLVSVLDPNGIPIQVLTSEPARDYLAAQRITTGTDTRGGPTRTGAGAAGSAARPPVTGEEIGRAVRVLHRYGLINHDPRAGHQQIRVHRLIQRATREALTGSGQIATLARTAADALGRVWPRIERDQFAAVLRANTAALQTATGTALWELDSGAHSVLFHAAHTLERVGQVAAAATEYTQLHATAARLLGPDHPITLSARGYLAHLRGMAGDVTGAAPALEELLADQVRVLGPDHLSTLITRSHLAALRGKGGDAAAATAAFEELLADQLRVLGPDHPGTLTTRQELATWRGEAGDAAGAITALEELLADQLRVLGLDDPNTLGTRANLAHVRAEAGDTAGAATAFEELLADQLRVLGPDHVHTLITRHNLAALRGRTGDLAGAIAALQELLADHVRVLGPDHLNTLGTRASLAYGRAEAGDAAGAATAFEELFADQLRVLGPDHPHTLTTRDNLTYWRGQAGLDEGP